MDSHDLALKRYLDPIVVQFEQTGFIEDDPISIPHAFDDPADRELIGLFAALLAWGRRDIMLRKLAELCDRMSFKPAAFIRDYHPARNRSQVEGFVHRTFNDADLDSLIQALQELTRTQTLEEVFKRGLSADHPLQSGLEAMSNRILDAAPGSPKRLKRHVARPSTGSACKRLNMYLRWMVRPGPVDFGQWTCINPADLSLPLDVHSGTQARRVGMLTRNANDWKAVVELTDSCRRLDPDDPCKYDFAFFGTGSVGEMLEAPAP